MYRETNFSHMHTQKKNWDLLKELYNIKKLTLPIIVTAHTLNLLDSKPGISVPPTDTSIKGSMTGSSWILGIF